MNTYAARPAIVFGVLSCRASAAAIVQFANAVAPHKVLVHHDFSQSPDFNISHENVTVLSHPLRTGWGTWSLVAAALSLMQQAVAKPDCDYFQLVSESCLPARPIGEFEEFLRTEQPQVMIDMLPLMAQPPAALINYGWRYLPRAHGLARLARRSGLWCLGGRHGHQQVCGVNLKMPGAGGGNWRHVLRAWLGRRILLAFLNPWLGRFPLGPFRQCWVGGQWFGVSRLAGQRILAMRARAPRLEAHYQRCAIPDESFIHTLVAQCAFPRLHPGNHITFWDRAQSGPDQLAQSDIARVVASGKFFARKFALDPSCPARQQLLSAQARLAQTPVPALAAEHAPGAGRG